MANQYGPRIVTDGLVLHLDAGNRKSYPGSGSTWYDLSGNGNNGTLVNGVGYNSGNNGSLSFDGANDYITLTSNPSLTNQITVEIFVKLNSTTTTFGWLCGRELSYRILYSSSAFYWVCATNNNGWYTPGTSIYSNTVTPHLNAYQVVATYDGSNNKIYVNGILNTTGPTISGNIKNLGTYYIMRDGSSDGNINYGKGNMICHKIYNRALSSSEIRQNFEATKGRYGL